MPVPSTNPPRRFRPRVEQLEDRCQPALIYWIAGSGQWDNPDNWSDGVPGADDDVVIDVPGLITVSGQGGAAVQSLECLENLRWAVDLAIQFDGEVRWSFTLEGKLVMSMGNMTLMGGGSIDGKVILTDAAASSIDFVQGHYGLAPGTRFAGAGWVNILGYHPSVGHQGDVRAENVYLGLNASLGGFGTFEIVKELLWTGGEMGGGVPPELPGITLIRGEANLSSPSAKSLVHNRQLVIQEPDPENEEPGGLVTWTDGDLVMIDGASIHNSSQFIVDGGDRLIGHDQATFNNLANGWIDLRTGLDIIDQTDDSEFNNFGTVIVNSELSSTTTVDMEFNHFAGLVTTLTGLLEFKADGKFHSVINTDALALTSFIAGNSTWYAGSAITGIGFGQFVGEAQGTLVGAFSAESIRLNGNATLSGSANLTVTRAMDWRGGTVQGPTTSQLLISASATLDLEGNVVLDGRTLLIDGQPIAPKAEATWRSGDVIARNGAVLVNKGYFMFSCPVAHSYQSGGGQGIPKIVNQGEMIKDHTGDVTIGVPFENRDTITIQIGVMDFAAGYNQDGNALYIAPLFGQVGLVKATEFILANGVVDGRGDLLIYSPPAPAPAGSLQWWRGTMRGAGWTTISSGATLSLLGPDSKFVDARRIISHGTAFWMDGDIDVNNLGFMTNAGTFNVHCDRSIRSSFPRQERTDMHFYNYGLFRKSGTGGITQVEIDFRNEAAPGAPQIAEVVIETGTLNLDSSGTHSAEFAVASGAILEFASERGILDRHVLNSGTYFRCYWPDAPQSPGLVRVRGKSIIDVPVPAVEVGAENLEFMADSRLIGGGTLAILTFTWLGGTMQTHDELHAPNPGRTEIRLPGASHATQVQPRMHIRGPDNKVLVNRILVNYGVATWTDTGDILAVDEAVITNHGLFDVKNDRMISATGIMSTFLNTFVDMDRPGIFRKSAGFGTTTIGVDFINSGTRELKTGIMKFDALNRQLEGGTTQLRGGKLASVFPVEILGGLLSGSGEITGSVAMHGIFEIGEVEAAGSLIITGNYTQGAGGTLNVDLTTEGSDNLVIQGAATLAGTLGIRLVNGFEPAPDDEFTILTYATVSGAFDPVPGFVLTYYDDELVLSLLLD